MHLPIIPNQYKEECVGAQQAVKIPFSPEYHSYLQFFKTILNLFSFSNKNLSFCYLVLKIEWMLKRGKFKT